MSCRIIPGSTRWKYPCAFYFESKFDAVLFFFAGAPWWTGNLVESKTAATKNIKVIRF